jgi:hypothetical protein
MRRKSKKWFAVLLLTSMLFSNFGAIGMSVVSAANIPAVLYEFYVGSDLPYQQIGFGVGTVGNKGSSIISETDFLYDDAGNNVIYGKINTRALYQAGVSGQRPYTGILAYPYDEINYTENDHMSVIDMNSIVDNHYVTMDVKIIPENINNPEDVNLDTYYVAIAYDVGWNGFLVNAKYSCIPISRYYKAEDIGTLKTITLPLKDFIINEGDPLEGRITIDGRNMVKDSPENTLRTGLGRACGLGVICYSDQKIDTDI